MSASAPLHAVSIALAVDFDGPLFGVLLLGPAGAGKSSLAISAIDSCPFSRTALVADDAVIIENGFACAPHRLEGAIEVRGFGPARIRSKSAILLRLALDLGHNAPRLPEPGIFPLIGGEIPKLPFQWRGAGAVAAARMRLIARQFLSGQILQAAQDNKNEN